MATTFTKITLNNGVEMPQIGFGTFRIPPEDTERCVLAALQAGYRMIDTAAAYFNEEGVGSAIKRSGIPREEIFVVTKLWIQDQGYEAAKAAIETSLQKLQLEYLDLYLIHQPFGDYYGSWRAMEEMLEEGKVRAIGVCNFQDDRFLDLILHNKVVPAINQIEINPFMQQKKTMEVFKENSIQYMAWAPLAQGGNGIFSNEVIKPIADKHHKTVAQIVLRWHIQRGTIVIPRSTKPERMTENLSVFDFELTNEEMEQISALDKGKSDIVDFYDIGFVKSINNLKIR